MAELHFKLMALSFRVRDFFNPPLKVLDESGIREGFSDEFVSEYTLAETTIQFYKDVSSAILLDTPKDVFLILACIEFW